MGRILPYIMENKKCSKPPTSIYIYIYIADLVWVSLSFGHTHGTQNLAIVICLLWINFSGSDMLGVQCFRYQFTV